MFTAINMHHNKKTITYWKSWEEDKLTRPYTTRQTEELSSLDEESYMHNSMGLLIMYFILRKPNCPDKVIKKITEKKFKLL